MRGVEDRQRRTEGYASYCVGLSIAIAGFLLIATLGEGLESAIVGASTATPSSRSGDHSDREHFFAFSTPELGTHSRSGLAASFARGARAAGRFSDDAGQALELSRYRRLAATWLHTSVEYPSQTIDPLFAELGPKRTRIFIQENVPSEHGARLRAFEALAKIEGPSSEAWSNTLDEINKLEKSEARVWWRTRVLEAQGENFSRWTELLADLKKLNKEDSQLRIEDLLTAATRRPDEIELFEDVRSLVLEHPNAQERASFLRTLAEAGRSSNLWNDAVAAAQELSDVAGRNQALLNIFKSGGPHRVLQLALENARDAIETNRSIAINLMKAIGEVEGPQSPAWNLAVETDRMFPDNLRTIQRIAEAHGPHSPAWLEALEFARAKARPDLRAIALLNIAQERPVGINVFSELLAAIEQSEGNYRRAFILAKTAQVYSNNDSVIHAALEAIRALDSASERTQLFLSTAKALGPESPAFDEAVKQVRLSRSSEPTPSVGNMAKLAQLQGDESPLWRELEQWVQNGSVSLRGIVEIGKHQGPSSFAWRALVAQAHHHPLEPADRVLLTLAVKNQPQLAERVYALSQTWSARDFERLSWLTSFALKAPDFSPAWDELVAILAGLDWRSQIETLLKLAEGRPDEPRVWRQFMSTLVDDVPSAERSHYEFKAGQLLLKDRVASPATLRGSIGKLVRAAGRSKHQMRALGNILVMRGDDFSEVRDPWSRSQLLRGASEMHSVLTEAESTNLRRRVLDELRSAEDSGRFEGEEHLFELAALGESLLVFDDSGSQSVLFSLLRAHKEDQAGLQILHLLSSVGNQRAVNMLLEHALGAEASRYDTTQTRQIIRRLVQNETLAPSLPGLIDAWAQEGVAPDNSYQIMRTLFQEAGVLPDTASLRWLREQLENADINLSVSSSTEIDRFLQGRLAEWKKQIGGLRALHSSELLRTLDADEDLRIKYFFLHSQRSNYQLVPRITYESFGHAIQAANEVESRVEASLFRKDTVPNTDFHQTLLERRRPSDDMVWQTTLTESKAEVQANLVATLRSTLRDEPFWLANEGLGRDNLSGLHAANIPEAFFRTLRGSLGQELTTVLQDGAPPTTLSRNDFAVAKKTLIARTRELQKQADEPARVRAWKAVRKQAEQQSDVMALKHLVAVLTDDPNATLSPKGAVDEWISHLGAIEQALADLRDATDRERTVTLRYLDGDKDFVEMLRFADGAACCFTSKNTVGAAMDTKNQWKSRINRDPHWFVIQIEESDPDALVRQSSGFVFGSFALLDDQPALALNGVYLQNKTDQAVATILDEIYERIARPAGIHKIAVAALHGGSAKLDPKQWAQAAGHTLERPRAIRDATGAPETQIYDDLGNTVNQPVNAGSHIYIRDYSQR